MLITGEYQESILGTRLIIWFNWCHPRISVQTTKRKCIISRIGGKSFWVGDCTLTQSSNQNKQFSSYVVRHNLTKKDNMKNLRINYLLLLISFIFFHINLINSSSKSIDIVEVRTGSFQIRSFIVDSWAHVSWRRIFNEML